MGISVLTALEIFTNPKDIQVAVSQIRGKNEFAFEICRGPKHNYKPMLTSDPFPGDLDGAINRIKETLGLIHKYVVEKSPNLAEHEHLTTELIEWIITQLKEKQLAQTWEFSTG